MSINEKLLGSQPVANKDKNSAGRSAETAGALREARNSGGDNGQGEDKGNVNSTRMTAKRMQAKRLRQKKLQEDRKSISFAHSRRLRFNILNLVTSWGATYFYIAYHWFQSKLGNKRKYVKLGSEWMDMPGMTEKQRDEIGSNFATGENCCFVSLSIGCFVALLLALLPLVIIGYFLVDPLEFIQNYFKVAWQILKFIFID